MVLLWEIRYENILSFVYLQLIQANLSRYLSRIAFNREWTTPNWNNCSAVRCGVRCTMFAKLSLADRKGNIKRWFFFANKLHILFPPIRRLRNCLFAFPIRFTFHRNIGIARKIRKIFFASSSYIADLNHTGFYAEFRQNSSSLIEFSYFSISTSAPRDLFLWLFTLTKTVLFSKFNLKIRTFWLG